MHNDLPTEIDILLKGINSAYINAESSNSSTVSQTMSTIVNQVNSTTLNAMQG